MSESKSVSEKLLVGIVKQTIEDFVCPLAVDDVGGTR